LKIKTEITRSVLGLSGIKIRENFPKIVIPLYSLRDMYLPICGFVFVHVENQN
jgi:hypothetical protein